MYNFQKIGLGGGCHWCTEAVFQSLRGVHNVEQGYISAEKENNYFSEAVVVHYDPTTLSTQDLIEIHLHTHKSMSDHSFRKKYRSAIYYFDETEKEGFKIILNRMQSLFDNQLVTKILKFKEFKPSRAELLDYYTRNPNKPFCKKYINPKLNLLKEKYSTKMK